jgi:hypothetical protein
MAQRTQLLVWVVGGGCSSWWVFCDDDFHVERRVVAGVIYAGSCRMKFGSLNYHSVLKSLSSH